MQSRLGVSTLKVNFLVIMGNFLKFVLKFVEKIVKKCKRIFLNEIVISVTDIQKLLYK